MLLLEGKKVSLFQQMGISPLLYTQSTKKQVRVLQKGLREFEHGLLPYHPHPTSSFSSVLSLSIPQFINGGKDFSRQIPNPAFPVNHLLFGTMIRKTLLWPNLEVYKEWVCQSTPHSLFLRAKSGSAINHLHYNGNIDFIFATKNL